MNTSRKLLCTGLIYAVAGLAGGVFYREFTKFHDFHGQTTLGLLHTHLLLLGMMMFLVLSMLEKEFHLSEHKLYPVWFVVYNAGLVLTVIMLGVRGVVQVLQTPLSAVADGAISGIAGLGHLGMGVGIVFIFIILMAQSKEEKGLIQKRTAAQ